MITLTSRVPLLLGTAATALLLVGCGANEVGEPEGAGSETPLSRIVTASPSAGSSSGGSASASPSSSAASPSSSPSSSSASSPSGKTSTDPKAELEIEDQSGDGSTVSVKEASTSAKTGFVGVYRGQDLLGSVKVGKGTLTVKLDILVPATTELQAVLFGDDGDGKLSADQDPRLDEKDFEYIVQ